MPTRNVVLTDHQAELLERLVASGHYQNASEVLREAVCVGVADSEAGRFTTLDSPAAVNRHVASIADRIVAQRGARGSPK